MFDTEATSDFDAAGFEADLGPWTLDLGHSSDFGPWTFFGLWTRDAMAQSRIDIFAEMVKQQPDDAMVWYGLANEYIKAERWAEAADALLNVLRVNPDYTSAYQLLGTALLNQGQEVQARRAWTDGIEVAERTGAWKARQHMEGLLKGIGPASADSGLCD